MGAVAGDEVILDTKDESKKSELGYGKDLLGNDNISDAETDTGCGNQQSTDDVLSTGAGEQYGRAVADLSNENEKSESGNKSSYDKTTADLIGETGALGVAALGTTTDSVIRGGKEKSDSGKQKEKKTDQDKANTSRTQENSDSDGQNTGFGWYRKAAFWVFTGPIMFL